MLFSLEVQVGMADWMAWEGEVEVYPHEEA